MPRPTPLLAVLLLPISACSAPMTLTGHITEGDITFTGTLTQSMGGAGTMVFSAPGGPDCDGVLVPSTARTPERLEGQIQCNDGRSGAIRMFLSPNLGVGSGRLGRDTITFRSQSIGRPPSAAEKAPSRGRVTLGELVEDGLAGTKTEN